MALSLADVVEAGHRGQVQRFQQNQMNRQQRDASAYDAAGQRATKAMQDAEAQGLDRQTAMLKGAETFGRALMEAGNMQGYLENEAKIHPLRLRTRQEAMQRFQMDGDKSRLIRSVYATIPNGEDVVGVEEVAGGPMPDRGTNPTPAPMQPKPQGLAAAINEFDGQVLDPLSQAGSRDVPVVQPGRPGDGRLGAPSGKSKLRVKVSTGDTRDVDFDQFLVGVQKLSQDPAKEIELNYRRALAEIEAGKQIRVAEAKGDVQRKSNEQMAGFRRTQAEVDAELLAKLQTQRDDAAMDRIRVQVSGSVRAAELRSSSGAGGVTNKVQSRFTDGNGNVVLVMRDGTHKQLVGDDGRPVKSFDFEKEVGRVAKNIGDSIGNRGKTPEQNRDAARRVLTPAAAPAAGGAKDYSNLWK
jgi:hypothetical protein